MEKKQIRASTKRRYALVAKAVNSRLGKMPVMMVYLEVAKELGLSEETVRRIMWEKKKRHKCEIWTTKKGFYDYLCSVFSEGPDSTDTPEDAGSQKIAADGYIPKIINSRSGRGGCWCCLLLSFANSVGEEAVDGLLLLGEEREVVVHHILIATASGTRLCIARSERMDLGCRLINQRQ